MSGRKKPMSADDLEERAEQLTRRVSARAKQDDDEDDEREPVADPETKRVVVDDEDDDDGDDERESEPSRGERRAARSRERGRLYRENEELKRRLDELERRPPPPVIVQAQPAAGPQKSPEDEAYDRDMRAIMAEAEQITLQERQLSGRKDAAGNVIGPTPEERTKLQEKWLELEQRRIDTMTQRSMARVGGGQQRGTTPEQVNAALLQGEYPDVFALQNGQPSAALRWSHARHQQLIAEGHPNTIDTARKALNEGRQRFGTAPAPRRAAPPPERRARYESVSRGGGGRDTDDERPRSVTMTQKQMAMAEERFPNVPAKEAHKLYAKRVLMKRRDESRA